MRIDALTKEVILTEDEYKNLLATKQEQPVDFLGICIGEGLTNIGRGLSNLGEYIAKKKEEQK